MNGHMVKSLWNQRLMQEEIIILKGRLEQEEEWRIPLEMWSQSWCVCVRACDEAGKLYPEGWGLVRRKVFCNKYKRCRKDIKRQICQMAGGQESWERWTRASNSFWCHGAHSLWCPAWVSAVATEGLSDSSFKELWWIKQSGQLITWHYEYASVP